MGKRSFKDMSIAKTLIQKEIRRHAIGIAHIKAQISIEQALWKKDLPKDELTIKKDAIRELNTIMDQFNKAIKELETDLKKL